jgi:hypothetical protein
MWRCSSGITLSRVWTSLRCVGIALATTTAVAVLAGCGQGSTSQGTSTTTPAVEAPGSAYDSGTDNSDYYPYADAQDAWDNQDGPDWEAFSEGYVDGWEAGCDLVFDESPDGYLYDQGEQFSVEDCYANEPFDASDADMPYEAPLDPEDDGYALGESDGCISAFELPIDGAFFYGPDEYDDSICP